MRFVDTSFWVALRYRRDQWHEMARQIWEEGPGALTTSDLVVGETWTFLRRRADHKRAVQFIDAVGSVPNLVVREVDGAVVEDAWRWLRRHDERPYSFVDATSFSMMRRLRLRESLSFDGDFAAAGFVEVR
ncbi:MAG: PIN domain-containing protein [Actinomycetota bacterium]